jgi:hypothetical protein
MEAYQIRVAEEREQLQLRTQKLEAFTESEAFGAVDYTQQTLLRCQLRYMRGYLGVLEERMKAFTP